MARHDETVAALEGQLAKARRSGEGDIAAALSANLRDLLHVGELIAREKVLVSLSLSHAPLHDQKLFISLTLACLALASARAAEHRCTLSTDG